MHLWDKNEIQNFLPSSWEGVAYDEFRKVLTEKKRIFPCTLGVAGFYNNQLRFGFIPEESESAEAGKKLAAMLQSYLSYVRTFGKNTSLVVFFDEERNLGIERYEGIFWDIFKREIRRKLVLFDGLSLSPDLGAYGDTSNYEWKQYVLKEGNEPRFQKCPFHYGGGNGLPEVFSTDLTRLEDVVSQLLPPTGLVEVQYDSPFRVHEQHHHNVDETLQIICGKITFSYEYHVVTCRVGDRLLLLVMTLHKSQAGESGCLYVIAARIIGLEVSGQGQNAR